MFQYSQPAIQGRLTPNISVYMAFTVSLVIYLLQVHFRGGVWVRSCHGDGVGREAQHAERFNKADGPTETKWKVQMTLLFQVQNLPESHMCFPSGLYVISLRPFNQYLSQLPVFFWPKLAPEQELGSYCRTQNCSQICIISVYKQNRTNKPW